MACCHNPQHVSPPPPAALEGQEPPAVAISGGYTWPEVRGTITIQRAVPARAACRARCTGGALPHNMQPARAPCTARSLACCPPLPPHHHHHYPDPPPPHPRLLPPAFTQVVGDSQALHRIACALRKARYDAGALRLDNTRLFFRLDEQGNPCDYGVYEQASTHALQQAAELRLMCAPLCNCICW